MSKKVYKNPSHEFDNQTISKLIHDEPLTFHQGKPNVVLYGNYTYDKDNEFGQFEKAFMFDGETNGSTLNNLVCIGDSYELANFCSKYYGNDGFASKYDDLHEHMEWIPFYGTIGDNEGKYFMLKSECIFVHDLNILLPINFKKGFRQIHFCKSCDTHYKRRCKCLQKSRPSGYSPNQIYFCDVENGFDVNSIQSLNHLSNQHKTFIGFEWELGFENDNLSTNEIAFAFYRHIKNKDVNLYNLFGDNMRDGSIDRYYNKGSEIGSNVMSFDYYKKYATMIEEVSEWANSRDIFGSNLGFHVNISRDSFANEESILNFLVLSQTSVEILIKLSGRRDGGSNMDSYCPIDIPFGYEDDEVSKINRGMTSLAMNKKLASKIYNGNSIGDKMSWMAFHKSHAIEFRLPSSSTDNEGHSFSKTCRHLELVFAMVEYSKHFRLEQMRFDKFLDWMHEDEHFVNIYNAIVCNDDIMELIEQSTSFAKQLSISKPNLEFDFDNDNTNQMEQEFKSWMDKCKNAKEVDDETKEIKNKYNKKLKDRKERKV